MSYYPKNYQDRIINYEDISSSLEDLAKIDFPESDEVDIASTQKEFNKKINDLESASACLLDNIWAEIHSDMDEAIKEYVTNVNMDREEEDFPFSDWIECAKFRYSKKDWKPTFLWLENVIKFNRNNLEKEALYLSNITAYLHAVKNNQPKSLLQEFLTIKNKLLLKTEYHNFFENLLFNNKIYEYIDSVRNNQTNENELNSWTKYASLEFLHNFGQEKESALWQRLFVYIKNSKPGEIEKNKKTFIDDIFNIKDNMLIQNFFMCDRTYGLKITDIKLETIKEFLMKDKQYNTGLKDVFLEKIKNIVTSTYSLTNKIQTEQNYNSFVLALKLEEELNESNFIVKKNKI